MTAFDIQVMRPRAVRPDYLAQRLEAISDSGIFSNWGPQVQELEERIANWLDVPPLNVVAVSNATVALSSAVAVSPPSVWVIPGWSFPATVLAPLIIGKKVRLVDIQAGSWFVKDDRDEVSTGLMNVIPFGGSFGQEAWNYPGEVIVDAAASLASRPRGLRDLPYSVAVVFSLHATKTMGGGEGGIVVFGSEERAQRARSWINFGFSGSRESQFIGMNGKMSEYDAAVANARLDGWRDESEEWVQIRQESLRSARKLRLDATPAAMDSINPYWIALFDTPDKRTSVEKVLAKAKIETRIWWAKGFHKMTAFDSLPRHALTNIDDLSDRYLGLPFHLGLSAREISRIAEIIDSVG